MKTIACLGSGSGAIGDLCYDTMVEVGRLLAQRGCVVATGGFGGAGMEAPARGAAAVGGKTVGYTIFGKQGNAYLSETVDCRKQYIKVKQYVCVGEEPHIEPPPEVQYGVRLGNLLTADGFIIAADGGPGTMVELMAVINLNYKLWKERPKNVAILNINGEDSNEWNAGMLDQLKAWHVLPREVRKHILVVSTSERAVSWATT